MRQPRRYLRTMITGSACISVVRKGLITKSFEGVVISVGFGGFGVRALLPVDIHSEVEAVLSFVDIDGKTRYETVQGKVVWDAEKPPHFLFGIQYLGLNKKDHPGLLSYLEAQKKEYERLILNAP